MKAWMRTGGAAMRATPLDIRVFKRVDSRGQSDLIVSIKIDLGGNFPKTVEIGCGEKELARAIAEPEVEEVVETIDDMLG